MSRGKLLLVTRSYPPDTGGIATYVAQLFQGMSNAGWEVCVFHVPRGIVDRTLGLGAETTELSKLNGLSLRDAVIWSDLIHMNGFVWKAVREAQKYKRRLVWTHHEYDTSCPIGVGWHNGCACKFEPLQCAKCLHDLNRTSDLPRRFGMLPVRRRAANQAHVNILPSVHLANVLQLPNSIVIPHGISQANPKNLPVEMSRWKNPTFVFLGRLVSEKGAAIVLSALSRCKNQGMVASLDMLGDGPLLPALKLQAAHLGIVEQVHFWGSVNHVAAMDALQTNNYLALVVPSTWDEVFGLVAIEAMSMGLPVIASDVGGLTEVVGDSGILIDRDSVDGLSHAMSLLTSNPKLWSELSTAGYLRYCSRFTARRMIDEHVKLYESATHQ